jgi:predicted nucleotidyltransferase component of viral defense system
LKNVEASVRARLTQKAKERGITFQYASVLYMQEGLLARIAGSPYARNLILKGGFLLFAIQQAAGRTTKDIDFLGDGIPNGPQALADIFAGLVTREYRDGLSFDVGSIRSERITEAADYHGVRLNVTARLGAVRNTIQVDIGFGDALEGGPRSTILRKLLDDTPLEIITYPLATVLAEKLESTIGLGRVNSRMKDLYDLWFILEHVPLADQEILAALRATFARRRTAMPESPAVFSGEFVDSERTKLLWKGFTRRSKLGNLALSSILDIITTRLEPLYAKIRLTQD